jgi:hypothetical protein
MSRILEFSPANEDALISRVLVLVHQTVDDHFPSAAHANRQFTKTVFSDDGENTALSHLPTPSQFGQVEDTSPDEKEVPSREKIDTPKTSTATTGKAPFSEIESLHASQMTEIGENLRAGTGTDWGTRITIAMLIAGLVMLAYVLLAPSS